MRKKIGYTQGIFIIILALLLSICGCDGKNAVSIESTEDTTAAMPSQEKEYSYDELRDILTEKLDEADYNDGADELFYDVFDALYNNYPDWSANYPDLPDTDDYIINNLIKPIENIENVYIHHSEEAAREAYGAEPPAAWTEYPTYESCDVHIWLGEEGIGDTELFYHEITHAAMMEAAVSDENGEDYILLNVLMEGGATFHMRFTNEFTTETFGMWGVSDGEYYMDYRKENCEGYLIDLNDYEKIRYVVGYGQLSAFERNEATVSDLIDTAASRYTREEAEHFFKLISARSEKYAEAYNSEGVFDMSVELENIFLGFIRQDMEKADGSDLEGIKAEYDYYVEKNLPHIYIEDTMTDVTEDFLDLIE